MPFKPSFWSQFEEPAVGGRDVDCLKTETRQREQPDHYGQHILGGTATKTATREHDDQDPDPKRFAAIPRGVACATQTMTKTREEPDQDKSAHRALGLPRAPTTHA